MATAPERVEDGDMRRRIVDRTRLAVVRAAVVLIALAILVGVASAQTDPLPSWNDGSAKQSIVGFVQAITDRGDARFVAPDLRIDESDCQSPPSPLNSPPSGVLQRTWLAF